MKNRYKFGEITIDDINFPNKGIGQFEGSKVTIKNTIPGQKIYAKLTKKHGSYQGQILELLEKSPMEIQPKCEDFQLCGGCVFQNIPYEYELSLKEKMVLDLFDKEILKDIEYTGIIPAPIVDGYRNKMEYSFGDMEKGGELALGMRKRNSFYEVVTSKNCNIVDSDYDKILKSILKFFQNSNEKFYHKGTHEGTLRHLIIRKGHFTDEILINLVTTSEFSMEVCKFVENILGLEIEGKIVGILHTENNSVADIVKSDKLNLLYGRDYFFENLLGLKFKISPFSFFQTNSTGAEKLYETVREFAEISKSETIFDLYCGTGTIAQILSPKAKKVIGIEIVAEAIEAAKENAISNDIHNCQFITGDVLKTLDQLEEKHPLIILDPPREGIHPKAIQKIINFGAEHIVYISCKPSSLVRDLEEFLSAGYVVEKMRLHDMFPRTGHVETVVLLSKLKIAKSIEVEIELDEMDLTTAESKATYAEIKQYVLDNTGFKVSQLYIAKVKRKHGLIERENYNVGDGKSKAPQVPADKEKAIEDALRYFQMI